MRVAAWLLLILLLGPILAMGWQMLSGADSASSFLSALGDDSLRNGLLNSFRVGLPAALASSLLGFMIQIEGLFLPVVARTSRRRRVALAVATAPVVVPELILAVVYSTGYRFLGVHPGMNALVVAYLLTGVPIARLLLAQLEDERLGILIEVGRDLGASRWIIVSRVIWPIARMQLVGVMTVLLFLYLNEFVIAFFLLGPGQSTFPIVVYSSLRFGMRPETKAMILLILIATMTLGGFLGWRLLSSRSERTKFSS